MTNPLGFRYKVDFFNTLFEIGMLISKRTSDRLEIDAPAKINLFLEVLGKRHDGYHDIYSLIQAVSLYDRLAFEVIDTAEVNIETAGNIDLTTGSDNLIARAYHLVRHRFGLKRGFKVRLEKNIPVAAGLGGGSSDGAAAILACNLLFDLQLTRIQMSELSLVIGSDLPFFFSSGQALVKGRGEVISEITLPTDYEIILVVPDLPISTAESYAALKRDLTKKKVNFNFHGYGKLDGLIRALRMSGNDFERVHLETYPVLNRIRDVLLDNGAILARMSGSGSAMFGVFYETPETGKGSILNRGCWQLCKVKPITWPDEAP
ncbi:MAG: 4-(cytidine 5'-diphospho)-2-C-methyl-D-erythritol kinase [candidate division Zixibacteria bacterium]|nr:4-(cytidine 5'-diphospho)-2-C-methyl-D-erythritol kinase [candidate division Zixibacteria bacterium]